MGTPENHLPQYSNDEGWLTGFPFDGTWMQNSRQRIGNSKTTTGW